MPSEKAMRLAAHVWGMDNAAIAEDLEPHLHSGLCGECANWVHYELNPAEGNCARWIGLTKREGFCYEFIPRPSQPKEVENAE